MNKKLIVRNLFSSLIFFTHLIAAEPANILVSDGDTLKKFSSEGVLTEEQLIPKNATSEASRDLIDMGSNGIAIFNGTFHPELSILSNNEWNHTTYDGWSIPNNGSYGGITSLENYIYVTDGNAASGPEKGIVRFNTDDVNDTTRFLEANEYIDITLGLDNNLYALRNTYGALDVVDPSTMTIIATLALGHTSSSRAVTADTEGNIYMASWNGNLYKYDENGEEIDFIDLSNGLYDIDINANGTILVSDRNGNIFISNTNLDEPVQFSSGDRGAFVAFEQEKIDIPIEYCDSSGRSTYYEWIDFINVNGIEIVTNNNNVYLHHEEPMFQLSKSNPHLIILQPGFRWGSYTEAWSVWIDFNSDGNFSDEEKVVYDTSKNQVSAAFSIPQNAIETETRMRVSMKYRNPSSQCEIFYYGEVEDYQIIISN